MKRIVKYMLCVGMIFSQVVPINATEETKEETKEEIQEGVNTIELSTSVLATYSGEIVLLSKGASASQDWIIQKQENGKYTIISLSDGKALTVNEEGSKKVEPATYKKKDTQYWEFEYLNGGYLLKNEKYLRIDTNGVYFVEDSSQGTAFTINFVRDLLNKEEITTEAENVSVSQYLDANNKIQVNITNPTSNATISGAKIVVQYPKTKEKTTKKTYYASVDETGNISKSISVKNTASQGSKYKVTVYLLTEGLIAKKLGTYTSVVPDELTLLQSKVEDYINTNKVSYEDWQVYYRNLKTGETFSVNDHRAQSASLIKLWVMGCAYDRYDRICSLYGQNVIDTALNLMITVSSNEGWMSLVQYIGEGDYVLGSKRITEWANENGYEDVSTEYVNSMNFCSSKDATQFMEDLYKNKYKHSEDMINLMLQQTYRHKIPSGIPDSNVKVANKTGELGSTENDCAIVYAQSGDYALCVMSTSLSSTSKAQSLIRGISNLIYTSLNE